MSVSQDVIGPLIVTLLGTAVLGVIAWLFLPYRNRLERIRMRMTANHGVHMLTYGPDEMGRLRPGEMLDMDPSWLVDTDFYFEGGVPGPGPQTETEWPAWARGHGGLGVGWRHILIRFQATQDRTVLVMKPEVNAARSQVDGGLVLSPVKGLGGNGLLVRQFYIDLDASPPAVEYYSQGGSETPQFIMRRGDSEAFLVIAHCRTGRYEWTLDIPILVDGETFYLRADNHGRPFTTLGPECVDGMWWDFTTHEWRPAEW
ncbi:hypothetical protein BH24ACT5_BH24ACT5_22590 [soil metagenome]